MIKIEFGNEQNNNITIYNVRYIPVVERSQRELHLAQSDCLTRKDR